MSLNLRRRHLNEGQRQWCAAKIANLAHGQKQSGKFAAHSNLASWGLDALRRAGDGCHCCRSAAMRHLERGAIVAAL